MTTLSSTQPDAPMALAEALRLLAKNPPAGTAPLVKVALACGFTPLHLQTFLSARLRLLYPDSRIEVTTGLFDDIPGTLRGFSAERFDGVVLVLEWADIDPRLGLRRLGGWSPRLAAEVAAGAAATLARYAQLVSDVARTSPVTISLPTLPLPPLFFTAGWQSSRDELRLRESLGVFASAAAGDPRVTIVNAQALDAGSPSADRLDVKSTWMSGFPYRTAHASRLAELLGRAVRKPQPKKGLITDLDDTLWSGIVGDDGPEGVTWDLDHHSQGHGLYQQFLRALAEEGVLIGVASKNDPAVVGQAFAREDLLLPEDHVFPLAVGWGSKAQAVSEVLGAWNVHADSVVFVDDNPIELAEVKAAHPAIECVQFPARDPQALYNVLVRLRDLFGRGVVSEDDAIRLASIRSSAAALPALDGGDGYSDAVLQAAEAELTLDFGADARDTRAFELVNKTNQFNLNGRRFTEREWAEYLKDPHAFLLTATYKDRYGALGKIAVVAGRVEGPGVRIDCWVMSCRAFARRIEHQCVKALFDRFAAEAVTFDYQQTARNGPITRFLADVLGGAPGPSPVLIAARFAEACPALPHRVLIKDESSHGRYANAAR